MTHTVVQLYSEVQISMLLVSWQPTLVRSDSEITCIVFSVVDMVAWVLDSKLPLSTHPRVPVNCYGNTGQNVRGGGGGLPVMNWLYIQED